MNTLRDCQVAGGGLTPYGVYADGGSFKWHDGHVSGMMGANFLVNEPTDPIRITDCDSDPSRKFIIARSRQGRTPDRQVIDIVGGRFMTTDGWLAENGSAFDIYNTGPFTLRSFQLGSGKQRVATLFFDALGPVKASVENVQFDAWGSSSYNPIRKSMRDQVGVLGCTYRDDAGHIAEPEW
jgi:hypothetical protein